MNYAIVFSSVTGNTSQIAEAVREALPEEDRIYYGAPGEAELSGADLIFVGFWTDKGTCDSKTADFFGTLDNKAVVLFGTAGFGGSEEYYAGILKRVEENLPGSCRTKGTFMCQGRLPQSVRKRYEAMLCKNPEDVKYRGLMDNFDKAVSHPDERDLENAKAFARKMYDTAKAEELGSNGRNMPT